MKENLKNKRGITLMALVITIIVLLILAGIAISMVARDNGILTKAARAHEMQDASTEKEKNTLNSYVDTIDSIVNNWTDYKKSDIDMNLAWEDDRELIQVDQNVLQMLNKDCTIIEAIDIYYTSLYENSNGNIDQESGLQYNHFGYCTLKRNNKSTLIETMTQADGNVTSYTLMEFYKDGILIDDLSNELTEGNYSIKSILYWIKDNKQVNIFSIDDMVYYLPDPDMTTAEFNEYYNNKIGWRYYFDDEKNHYWRFRAEYADKKCRISNLIGGYIYQTGNYEFIENINE